MFRREGSQLFDHIFDTPLESERMSEEWRCVLILILKNKGDEWKGFNYREMMWRKAWQSGGMLQKEEVQKSVEAKHDHETERWKGEVDKGF